MKFTIGFIIFLTLANVAHSSSQHRGLLSVLGNLVDGLFGDSSKKRSSVVQQEMQTEKPSVKTPSTKMLIQPPLPSGFMIPGRLKKMEQITTKFHDKPSVALSMNHISPKLNVLKSSSGFMIPQRLKKSEKPKTAPLKPTVQASTISLFPKSNVMKSSLPLPSGFMIPGRLKQFKKTKKKLQARSNIIIQKNQKQKKRSRKPIRQPHVGLTPNNHSSTKIDLPYSFNQMTNFTKSLMLHGIIISRPIAVTIVKSAPVVISKTVTQSRKSIKKSIVQENHTTENQHVNKNLIDPPLPAGFMIPNKRKIRKHNLFTRLRQNNRKTEISKRKHKTLLNLIRPLATLFPKTKITKLAKGPLPAGFMIPSEFKKIERKMVEKRFLKKHVIRPSLFLSEAQNRAANFMRPSVPSGSINSAKSSSPYRGLVKGLYARSETNNHSMAQSLSNIQSINGGLSSLTQQQNLDSLQSIATLASLTKQSKGLTKPHKNRGIAKKIIKTKQKSIPIPIESLRVTSKPKNKPLLKATKLPIKAKVNKGLTPTQLSSLNEISSLTQQKNLNSLQSMDTLSSLPKPPVGLTKLYKNRRKAKEVVKTLIKPPSTHKSFFNPLIRLVPKPKLILAGKPKIRPLFNPTNLPFKPKINKTPIPTPESSYLMESVGSDLASFTEMESEFHIK